MQHMTGTSSSIIEPARITWTFDKFFGDLKSNIGGLMGAIQSGNPMAITKQSMDLGAFSIENVLIFIRMASGKHIF